MSRQLSPAEFCAEEPKVELHVHLEGAFDGPYLFECARKCVHDLPASVDLLDGRSMALQEAVRVAASEQAFLAEHIYLPPTCAKLTDFLAPFPISMAIVHASVRAEGLGCIEEFAYRFARRQHAAQAVYTELRYCPHLFLEEAEQQAEEAARLASAEAVVRAVGRGLRRGEAECGVLIRQILACLDFAPQWSADQLALLARVGKEEGLVGIDVAAGERHFGSGPDGQPDAPTLQAVLGAKAAGFGVAVQCTRVSNLRPISPPSRADLALDLW